MSPWLVASGATALIALLAVVLWLAALPSLVARMAGALWVAAAAWLLAPFAIETGLRDLSSWLATNDRARDLAAFATIDGLLIAALALHARGPRTSQGWPAWRDWIPPLSAPMAVFAICLLVAQTVDSVEFAALRAGVTVTAGVGAFALATIFALASPTLAARLELRLIGAVLLVLSAAALASIASAPPAVTAVRPDFLALALISAGGLIVAIAGFVYSRRRLRR